MCNNRSRPCSTNDLLDGDLINGDIWGVNQSEKALIDGEYRT